jgi:L-asparaginase II
MRLQIEVVVSRGPIAESTHRVEAVASTPEGRLELETGEAGLVTTFRSAAKPFQMLPLVERGHADRWGFSEEELAVMSASHVGSAYHVGLVRKILARIGRTESDLECGSHDPIDPESLAEFRRHPERRSALYNNCSGKHAGMVALALAEGWPVEGYARESHPVQRLMRRTVAELAGLAPEALLVGVDGCSVSVFGMPVSAMARAYARLGSAGSGDAREQALARIRGAMLAHPLATGGEGRFSTALMERTGGRIVAKGGAEGLECLALPERRLGLAFKCVDGESRAIPPAVIAVLEHLGMLDPGTRDSLEEFRRPRLHNHAGLEVGSIVAHLEVPSGQAAGR